MKRRYPFPEGSSFLMTPLGNRALASSSESVGMTMTFSPTWARHKQGSIFKRQAGSWDTGLSDTCGFCHFVQYLLLYKINFRSILGWSLRFPVLTMFSKYNLHAARLCTSVDKGSICDRLVHSKLISTASNHQQLE